MFGPRSADTIETSSHYYRVDSERWAANERLVRLARAGRPGLLARALGVLTSLSRGQRRVFAPESATPAGVPPVLVLAHSRPAAIVADAQPDAFEADTREIVAA